ncbi:hypothetical protein GGR55DRAFT_702040 [Xylaria sp. FL0064]|nr:hypothetical protein GGR55DRAFT_702040 [Xylaria sp. FL0064]
MEIAKIVRDTLSTLGSLRKRRRQQNLDTYLLKLPVELILRITDFLSPSNLILFSQTCYSVHAIVQENIDTTKLSRTEYLSYLATCVRAQPKKWLFSREPPALVKNTDESGGILAFGTIKYDLNTAIFSLLLSIFAYKSKSMTPICKPYWRHTTIGPIALEKGPEKISLKKIGYLPICPHVIIDPFRTWRRYDDPDNQLEEAIERSLWTHGDRKEYTGAFSRCATDFSVQSDSQFLDLCVWQDFGPEGSPGDLAWEIHCDSVGLDGVPNCWDWGHTLYHKPGTVRKLYGKYEECEAMVASASLADKVMSIFNGIWP